MMPISQARADASPPLPFREGLGVGSDGQAEPVPAFGSSRFALTPTPNPSLKGRGAEGGFTLIELMVVVTLIGLLAAAVVVNMPDPRGRLSQAGERFAARVAAARDRAVVSERPTGLYVSASGYGFESYADGRWEPMSDGPLAAQTWPDGVAVSAGGQAGARVAFDALGLPDQPVDVVLVREDERVTVALDASGGVVVR